MWRSTADFPRVCVTPFESPKVFDRLRIPAEDPLRKTVQILNPLGEDFSIMRTTSLNGMLTSPGYQLQPEK